jgi:hypothetical protein
MLSFQRTLAGTTRNAHEGNHTPSQTLGSIIKMLVLTCISVTSHDCREPSLVHDKVTALADVPLWQRKGSWKYPQCYPDRFRISSWNSRMRGVGTSIFLPTLDHSETYVHIPYRIAPSCALRILLVLDAPSTSRQVSCTSNQIWWPSISFHVSLLWYLWNQITA